MSEKNQSEKKGVLKLTNEILATIVGIITSLTVILNQTKVLGVSIDQRYLLVGVDIINLLVLIIALIALHRIKETCLLDIDKKEYANLKKHLMFNTEDEPANIVKRVNNLIKQLIDCIFWFALILGIFYVLQWIMDASDIYIYSTLKGTLTATTGIFDIFDKRISSYVNAAKYLTLEFFTNTTNLFSAAYLILAFQVLFSVTLENDNITWKLKKKLAFSIALAITLANALFFLNGIPGSIADLSSISHIMRLTGGIYNGVAMFLLFSRFIAMEFFFQNSKDNWQKKFYFCGIVFILPMYVVAQPLYGLFNALEVTLSAEVFKLIVFLVCFWGKLVFLLFVYTMLTKKWIHSYLFLILSQKDSLLKISLSLEDVEDFVEPKDDSSPNENKMKA